MAMLYVGACLPQLWADPDFISETMITAYYKTALVRREKHDKHTYHIYPRNLSCGDGHYAGDKDKHIPCQFPTPSHQHDLDH